MRISFLSVSQRNQTMHYLRGRQVSVLRRRLEQRSESDDGIYRDPGKKKLQGRQPIERSTDNESTDDFDLRSVTFKFLISRVEETFRKGSKSDNQPCSIFIRSIGYAFSRVSYYPYWVFEPFATNPYIS